jgi:hypothetical protein
LTYLAAVIRRHRKAIGSCWRKLNPGAQALLVLGAGAPAPLLPMARRANSPKPSTSFRPAISPDEKRSLLH